MFCRECGAECKDDTNFCPECGASLQLETSTNESETDQSDIPESDTSTTSDGSGGKKKRKFHWWILIIVAAIVVVIIILARVLPNSSSSGDYTIDVGGTVTALGEGFTNREVTDSDSAILAAQDVANDLGYKNAFDELSLYAESPTDGRCYYRLQQNYSGIPVYQRYTTLVASEDGEPLGLFTDAVDVQEGISLTPTITYEDAVASINEYASNNWDSAYDDMSVPELSDNLLVIFNQNDSLEACLAYALTVENDNTYTVVLNANTGEVLDCVSNICDITKTGTNVDKSLEFPVEYNDAKDTYIICDPSQNIYVYNLRRANGEEGDIDLSSLSQPESDNTIFGDTSDEQANGVDIAISLYTNVNKIIDFYKTFNQDIPYKYLLLFYNDGFDNGENAYAGPVLLGDETVSRLSIGYAFDGTETDMLAHEYTHLVQYEHDAAIGSGCDYGIKEGIADVFSCFYNYGSWDIDLTKSDLTHRNAEEPSEYKYPTTFSDPNESEENNEHAYATVLSHAAYLMDASPLFATNQIEQLWYETLLILPTNCLYEDFYVCMKNVTNLLGFSDEQKEAISDILSDLGFDRSESTGKELSFNVYDKQKNLYDDYTIQVNGHEFVRNNSGTKDFHEEYKVNNAETYELELPEGVYTLSVIDNAGQQEKRFFVSVSDAGNKETYECYDFGADYVVAPGAKLTVVDEEGNEITDYLAYTETTNEKGEDVIVSLSDGTISLPELNYYTFIIEVERTTSTATSNVMETKPYKYNVRVKEGADDELKITISSDSTEQDETPPSAEEALELLNLFPVMADELAQEWYNGDCEIWDGKIASAEQVYAIAAFATVESDRYQMHYDTSADGIGVEGRAYSVLPTDVYEEYLRNMFGEEYNISNFVENTGFVVKDNATGTFYISIGDYGDPGDIEISIEGIADTANEDGSYDILAKYYSSYPDDTYGPEYILYQMKPDASSDYGYVITDMIAAGYGELDEEYRSMLKEADSDEESYMEWQQLYADYLEQFNLEEDTAAEEANEDESWGSTNYYYYLIYLNDDDVPELLCGSSPDYNRGNTVDHLLYIQDSEVKEQEIANAAFAERGGYISGVFSTGAYMTYNVWRLNEQNELVTELDAYEDFTEITVNGQAVSEEEYNQKVQEGTAWESSGEYTVLRVGDGTLDLYDSGEKYASPFATGASAAAASLRDQYIDPI